MRKLKASGYHTLFNTPTVSHNVKQTKTLNAVFRLMGAVSGSVHDKKLALKCRQLQARM